LCRNLPGTIKHKLTAFKRANGTRIVLGQLLLQGTLAIPLYAF
jgi:hypothetical protein